MGWKDFVQTSLRCYFHSKVLRRISPWFIDPTAFIAVFSSHTVYRFTDKKRFLHMVHGYSPVFIASIILERGEEFQHYPPSAPPPPAPTFGLPATSKSQHRFHIWHGSRRKKTGPLYPPMHRRGPSVSLKQPRTARYSSGPAFSLLRHTKLRV